MEEILLGGELVRRQGKTRSEKSVSEVQSLVNLRPRADGGLEPVGRPLAYTTPVGGVPLCRINVGEEPKLLVTAGNALFTIREGVAGAATKLSDILPGEAMCTLPCGSSEAVIMTDHGAVRVLADEAKEVEVRPVSNNYPPLLLSARGGTPVGTTVPSRTLNSVYALGMPPDKKDSASLSGDLTAAYLRLCASAESAGTMIQPALCRYRLCDKYGHVIYTSPVVLLSADSGAQCASMIGLMSSDRHRIESYTLTADTWRLELTLPDTNDASLRAQVGAAEIFMSPLFHPYHPSLPAEIRAGRGSEITSPYIYIGLPGRQYGLGDDYEGCARRQLMRAIARMDTIERRVAVVSDPYGRGSCSITLEVAPAGEVGVESSSLQAILGKKVTRKPCLQTLLSSPHTFVAGKSATDGSTVVWADITVQPSRPYALTVFASKWIGSGEWRATTTVKFSDGRGVVLEEEHKWGAPVSFSPVISYPSPDATEMTITYTYGGKSYTQSFPLESDESGSCAVYIAERIVPMALPSGVPSPQSFSSATLRYANVLALAPAERPFAIDSVVTLGDGVVKAILPRIGSEQSWEFGRSRFIAATASGIYSVASGAGRKTVAVRALSHYGISRSDSIASGDGGEVFALVGGTGSKGAALMVINSSGRFKMFECPRHYTALAYNEVAGELWALRSDGSADIFCRGHEWDRYMREAVDFEEVVYVSGEPFGLTDKGFVSICNETAEYSTDVEIVVGATPRKYKGIRARKLILHGVADRIYGELKAEGCDEAGGNRWPIVESVVSGSCQGSLGLGLVSRCCRKLLLRFRARVSPDFVFRFFRLNYE